MASEADTNATHASDAMAPQVQASEAQQALFSQWSDGTNFALDVRDSPKRQFNVLAQLLGWTGGDEPWNANWKACFDEDYIWRGDGATLDGDDENDENSTGALPTIWTRYPGFTPDPEADFVDEFNRLAEHQGWTVDEQKKKRPEFIEAEFASYYGVNSKSLRNWRKLCRVCCIERIPHNIDDCKEALRGVLVNIVNLVNNRRSGEPVLIFPTKRQFLDYTCPDRTYPLNKAVENALMITLLRPVNSPRWSKKADEEFAEFVEGRLQGVGDMTFLRIYDFI